MFPLLTRLDSGDVCVLPCVMENSYANGSMRKEELCFDRLEGWNVGVLRDTRGIERQI